MQGLILFANGMEDAEAIYTRDLLIRSGFEMTSFSFEGKCITTSYGIKMFVDKLWSKINVDDYDFIVVPGGKYATSNPIFAGPLKDMLIEFNNKNKTLCLICAAPLFLKGTNILKNKTYTCFKDINLLLGEGTYVDEKTIIDANLVTAKSAGVIQEFVFSIIEKLISSESVKKLKSQLLI